jgi:hypothetical protein
MNAYTADDVSLSVCVVQLKNCWMDLDEVWHGCYAFAVYPKIVLFNFLQSVILTWQTNEFVRWD